VHHPVEYVGWRVLLSLQPRVDSCARSRTLVGTLCKCSLPSNPSLNGLRLCRSPTHTVNRCFPLCMRPSICLLPFAAMELLAPVCLSVCCRAQPWSSLHLSAYLSAAERSHGAPCTCPSIYLLPRAPCTVGLTSFHFFSRSTPFRGPARLIPHRETMCQTRQVRRRLPCHVSARAEQACGVCVAVLRCNMSCMLPRECHIHYTGSYQKAVHPSAMYVS
jgi:hypothetical protein